MSWFMVDIESDGPAPGLYSMLSLGVVLVDESLDATFYTEMKPISDEYEKEALAVNGFTREQTMKFKHPEPEMEKLFNFVQKVNGKGRPMFVSDNNGFDWQFVNYYFHKYVGINPFGHSSTNLGSLFKGMRKDMWASFKYLRKTKHTHNALDDAKGNAEALLAMKKMGLRISLR